MNTCNRVFLIIWINLVFLGNLVIVDMKVKRLDLEGFHNWHFENGTVTTSQRHFVIQVYLNDDFEVEKQNFV